MSNITIKKITAEKWEEVWNIIRKVTISMEKKGLNQWSGYYNPTLIKSKFEHGEVFVLYVDELPVATASISNEPPQYYSAADISNFSPTNRRGYLSTLAVLEEYQGRGLGKMLVSFREKYSKDNDLYEFLAFDASAADKKLIEFHKKNGFEIVGTLIDDEDKSEYLLFEKQI